MLDEDIFNKFTKHLKNTLRTAGILARTAKAKQVEPVHLLQGIIKQPGSLAAEVLHKNGLRQTTESTHIPNKPQHIITLELNQQSQKIITKMLNIAYEHQHQYIGTEHLLMALLNTPDEKIVNLLQQYNLSLLQLKNHLTSILKATSNFSDITEMFSDIISDLKSDNKNQALPGVAKNMMLDTLSTDLTNNEIQEKIDPVIGRNHEIERLIQILSRRHKNNPLLLGDPGVGKTAIVEGLAKKITKGEVPESLLNKKILHLDLGSMVAGTMYRGEFEARLKNVLDEIKNNPNIIVFIDELHNIIGAGSTSGGTMDVANLIKPALARGEIRCIGATTQAEYRKYIETDPALERRFQIIQVDESTPQETEQILQGLKNFYEKFHQVKINDDSIKTAIEMSDRYIPDKFLPDKAIDLIDEAASRVKINRPVNSGQKRIIELEKQLASIEKNKNQAILTEQYEEALKLKNQEQAIHGKLNTLRNKVVINTKDQPEITAQDVIYVVSQITKIPLAYLSAKSDKKLQDLQKKLSQNIIGQDDILETVVNVIKRAQTGMSSTAKPIGSFLFLGPSGVGKTELAKVIAREYFGNEDAMVRIDMSEFSESFNMSKLIGAPAGYVGYRESGKLTESIKRKPYTVVLFDEIEKGHPDIFNILLQILDEGQLTDAEGKKIDFRHTIIILTSNLASEKFGDIGAFGFSSKQYDHENSVSKIKNQVMTELEEHFRPELLNRLDNISIFNPLTQSDLKKIIRLQLKELDSRLLAKDITLKITTPVISHLAKISGKPNKGAREIRRNIQNLIEQPLADMVIDKNISNKTLEAKLAQDKIILSLVK